MIKNRNTLAAFYFPALLFVAGLASGCGDNPDRLEASGTVEATEARLGFLAVGRIEAIYVDEGDAVGLGDELAVLDRAEARARVDQAEAQAAAARALLTELEGGFRSEEIAQGEAAFAAATDRREDAARDLDRARRLFDGGAVSREALDKAQVAFDVAKSQAEQAAEQLSLLRSGPRAERIAAQRAGLAQAEAGLRAARVALENMTIRAPFAGRVSIRHREPGETVPLGAPVLTITNPADRWVRIYIPEDRIGGVRIGQGARIRCDTYPDKTYRGEVVYIASEAEFTPKSVQTAAERVKLVYAVKVRVREDPDFDLKVGVPADVVLEAEGEA